MVLVSPRSRSRGLGLFIVDKVASSNNRIRRCRGKEEANDEALGSEGQQFGDGDDRDGAEQRPAAGRRRGQDKGRRSLPGWRETEEAELLQGVASARGEVEAGGAAA